MNTEKQLQLQELPKSLTSKESYTTEQPNS